MPQDLDITKVNMSMAITVIECWAFPFHAYCVIVWVKKLSVKTKQYL